ncbi:hypothetical protein GMMP1_160042 [Candidatus Magnetomoraceae bacterium gMMP-1]
MGRGFDSLRWLHFLFFTLIFNYNHGGVPEWPKGTDCKSVGDAFGGSNPPPTTILFSFILSGSSSVVEL